MIRLFTGLTDPGMVRTVNQDAFYLDDPEEGRFLIVADGMGGHAGGQEASHIATQEIQNYLNKYWSAPSASEDLLQKALLAANEAIVQDQSNHPERSDMGTTAVVVMFRSDRLWYSHVGDSRLYLLRDSKLEQITEDHTWVSKAMQSGDLTQDQARVHPWRHVLSQCLGRQDLHEIEVQSLDVLPGDRLLLCSDGLTEELPDAEIASYLQSQSTGEKAAAALIDAAKKHGGRDNITVVIVAID